MKHIGRIKVVTPNENIMECICVCPHCGEEVRYGSMMMVSGVHCCPNCNVQLHQEMETDKEASYETYVNKVNGREYEPYRSPKDDFSEAWDSAMEELN